MVVRYYCDFCDKQFIDNPVARRRHMRGMSHQRNKKMWYQQFKGPHHPPNIVALDNTLPSSSASAAIRGSSSSPSGAGLSNWLASMARNEKLPPSLLPPTAHGVRSLAQESVTVDWG
eukprot:TRINITY_DN4926_c0_g1_i3.p1 TRINITY_DN4926_c0_g1~~TRINITY_DN4926_c0_g1_i3.p1  ORF type:complete len:117 (-),score=20.46 TRINITY_DN4926_c0_g1_i3:118-468(-)